MGYGMQFPANQVGGWILLWDITGYGLSGVWVKRGSTVVAYCDNLCISRGNYLPNPSCAYIGLAESVTIYI
jgi:hypothetical protein